MITDTDEELVQVLNDLIRINNDRIRGYEKAIQKTDDTNKDLVEVFSRMIDESRQYKAELGHAVQNVNGKVAPEETTMSGKLYRFWTDLYSAVAGKNIKSLLDDCEFGEDAVQKAYREAIETDATAGADIRRLILNQKSSLKTSHDTIKRMRDTHKLMNESQKKGKPTY